MNLEEQKSTSHGSTFLFFMFVDFSCLKFMKKNYQKRFLVSEFISNVYLINKIHWLYFVNTCLGGLKFLHPTPLKREKV